MRKTQSSDGKWNLETRSTKFGYVYLWIVQKLYPYEVSLMYNYISISLNDYLLDTHTFKQYITK